MTAGCEAGVVAVEDGAVLVATVGDGDGSGSDNKSGAWTWVALGAEAAATPACQRTRRGVVGVVSVTSSDLCSAGGRVVAAGVRDGVWGLAPVARRDNIPRVADRTAVAAARTPRSADCAESFRREFEYVPRARRVAPSAERRRRRAASSGEGLPPPEVSSRVVSLSAGVVSAGIVDKVDASDSNSIDEDGSINCCVGRR